MRWRRWGLGAGTGWRTFILPNGLPAIVTFLAASVAGTAAPLNPGYREEEVNFYLEDTAAKLLLCPADAAGARKAAEARGVPVYALEMDSTGYVRIAGAPRGKTASAPTPDDIALILHTSGSTGRPKRVPIAHKNMAASTHNIAAHYSLTPSDVSLCVMPLFHVHGLVASTLSTLLSGGTVVAPEKFSPLSFWRTVRDTRRDVWYSAVPTIHNLLLARSRRESSGGRRRPALHSLVQRIAAAGDDGADGTRLRRARAGSVWDDRGVAPDVVEPAASVGAKAGVGGTGYGRQDRDHERRRQFTGDGRIRRGGDPGAERGCGV